MSHAIKSLSLSLRRSLSAATFCAAIGLLAGCGGGETPVAGSKPGVAANSSNAETGQGSGKIPGVLRRSNGAEPGSLDPHLAEGVPASNVLRDLYEGLMTEKANGELTGGVAESWDVSDDGLSYTFTFRDNAKWSNGEPVTPNDFVYSLRRAVDPKTRSTYADVLSPILNASDIIAGKLPTGKLGVVAVDGKTLRIRLQGVTPYFLGLLAHATSYPVYQKAVEQYGDKFVRPENTVTNGAFKLVEHTPRALMKLQRNTHYWNNDSNQINTVFFYPIEDQAAALKRYEADEVDFAESPPSTQVDRIKKKYPDEFTIFSILGTYYFEFNVNKKPFNNAKLRQALSLAIDRQIIIDRIGKLDQQPAFSWVPPGTDNYKVFEPEYASWSQEQRNAAAKKLFAEATNGQSEPVEVQILYNTSESHKKISLAISQMWEAQLGVKTTLVNQEWKVFLKTRDAGDFQVARAGWVGDYNDPFTFLEILLSKHGQNNSNYNSSEYDRLVGLAANMPDLEQRAQLIHDAEKILVADAPVIPLYFYTSVRLVKPWVKGFEPNVLGHFRSSHFRVE